MKLVERHIIKRTNVNYKKLVKLTNLSCNLYNSALYVIRQHFFNKTNKQYDNDIASDIEKTYLNYYDLNTLLKETCEYTALPSNVNQEILKLVDNNFKSFFTLFNKKKQKSSSKKFNIPKYNKTNQNILIYNVSTLSKHYLDLNIIKIPKSDIKLKILHNKNAKQVRIIPKNGYIIQEVIYDADIVKQKKDNNRYMSIDIGINNLASCSSNVIKSFIINGRPIKSINQYYNKKKSKLQSNNKKVNNTQNSNRISKLTLKRNNKIDWYMHNASSYIVNQLVSNNINTLVIGSNKEWKQDTNMGKRNNQNFVSIPFDKLKRQLEYKCKLNGIIYVEQEESYTSKCSFLDNETIQYHDSYCGKRITRGLFKTKENHYINADINGSLNILKKYLNVASNIILNERSRGLVVSPNIITFK